MVRTLETSSWGFWFLHEFLVSTWVFSLHGFSNDATCLNAQWFTLFSAALCIYVNSKELQKNVSFLGFVCVSMWQGVYKANDLTGYSKGCKKYWKILYISHLNPIKQSHSVTSVAMYRAQNSVIFFFLCLVLPCSNTVPTETSNKISPLKKFFIKPLLSDPGKTWMNLQVLPPNIMSVYFKKQCICLNFTSLGRIVPSVKITFPALLTVGFIGNWSVFLQMKEIKAKKK